VPTAVCSTTVGDRRSNAILWYLADGTEFPTDPTSGPQGAAVAVLRAYSTAVDRGVRFLFDYSGQAEKLRRRIAANRLPNGLYRARTHMGAQLTGRTASVGERYTIAGHIALRVQPVADEGASTSRRTSR